MGQKDLSEKILADYNDVFADIINVLILGGQRKIQGKDLIPDAVHSQYKADDGMLHEQERDVSKYWKKQKIHLALFGMENQTAIERNMPFRIIGYDGAAYRQQLQKQENSRKRKKGKKKKPAQKPVPVITLVLHFGTKKRWDQPLSIKELLDIPDYLDAYVSDYRIHVFDIAWLTEEQLAQFESDFGIVANFFVQKRKNKDYIPEDARMIRHVDEVLKLLSVMTGDSRYESILSDGVKEGISMCDVAERLEQRGIRRGIEQGLGLGREQGIKQGIEQGLIQGREQGLIQGREQGLIQGREQGLIQGREQTLYHLVSTGNLSVAIGAQEMQVTEDRFLAGMKEAGYKMPDEAV